MSEKNNQEAEQPNPVDTDQPTSAIPRQEPIGSQQQPSKSIAEKSAVPPVIGVILMVAITVILAAVIAAFVFGLGGSQAAAPTASIVAANNPDTGAIDMKIQHKGGDTLKGGDWKLSVVAVGTAPAYVISNSTTGTFSVGNQISTTYLTNGTTGTYMLNASTLDNPSASTMVSGQKYDVKLVHIPSNAMLVDAVVEVR